MPKERFFYVFFMFPKAVEAEKWEDTPDKASCAHHPPVLNLPPESDLLLQGLAPWSPLL